MSDYLLLTPGPTQIPPSVLKVMSKQILHHRTSEYRQILKEANQGLRDIFQTKNDVLTFASSGTGGMESVVVNLFSPGDTAIVAHAGKFGERFQEICRAYGVKVVSVSSSYGSAINPEEVKKAIQSNPQAKALLTTLCETSTGTLYDIQAVAALTRSTDIVCVVDAISGLATDNLPTDEWGVDIVIAGSQKGLMVPPGLAFVSISEKAWNTIKLSKMPRYYFDFLAARKSFQKDDSRFTPPVSLVTGLCESIRLIKEEGLLRVIQRHTELAKLARRLALDLGLKLFSDRPSNALTALKTPEGMDIGVFLNTMREKERIILAEGQGDMKGKIFRVAHLGYCYEKDVRRGFDSIAKVLSEMGYRRPVKGMTALR